MDQDICQERHKTINQCIERQNIRLDNHGKRLDNLEKFESSTRVEIRNLIDQIKSLISTIKWGTGLTITTLLAFFIWYIQRIGG